jgi:ATP-dependent DNA helicase DinG
MLNITPSFRPSSSSSYPAADVLPPCAYGLPSKFSSWRAQQLHAIDKILTSPKRFITICMPTGGGKSLACVGAAMMSGRRAAILTSTKGLQDQISSDFDDAVTDIRGLSNYICPIAKDQGMPAATMVSDAPCACGYKCSRKMGGGCEYYDIYRIARQADVVVTNYQCWMYDNLKIDNPLGSLHYGMRVDDRKAKKVEILFLDECHDACEEVSRFVGMGLSRKECLALHLPWLDPGSTVGDWNQWAEEHWGNINNQMKSAEANVRRGDGRGWHRGLKYLKDMDKKLAKLLNVRAEDDWIVSEEEVNPRSRTMSAVRFDPLSPARYAEPALFQGVEKIVLVSATVRPKTAAMLGIAKDDMEFVEYPSTFAVERRPVVHVPSIRMTFHTEQDDDLMREWLEVIDEWMAGRLALGRKGIIHAVSYKRSRFILNNSRHKQWMVTHSAHNRPQIVEEFRRSEGPLVLVSPSVDTGYDFKDDAARFQIVAKLPFASTQDPLVKARQAKDADYGLYQVAQTLVQMTGRIVRSDEDWGETLIADQNIEWALPRMKSKGFLPKWWMDGFRSLDVAPEPVEF